MRKLLISIILLTLLLPSYIVNATPVEDLRWVIDSRIQAINKELESNYKSQTGLLRKLQFLSSKILWLELAEDSTGELGISYSTQAKLEMREDLGRDLENFNKQFGSTTLTPEDHDYFMPLSFDLWQDSNGSNHLSFYSEYIKNTIPNYIENLLKPINQKYQEADSTAKTVVIREHQAVLKYSFRVLNTLTTLESEFSNITGGVVKVTRSDKAFNLLSAESPINYLVQRGKEIDLTEAAIGTSTGVLTEGDYITRLAFVKMKETDKITTGTLGVDLWEHSEIESEYYFLREAYIKMVSAGAVYRPFISKVGDPDFLAALESLYEDVEDKKRITGLFQSVKEYKKPLFKTTELGYDTWNKSSVREYKNDRASSPSNIYEGTADLVYLKDFMKMIDSRSTFGLVMKQGVFRTNTDDMNSYSYYSDNPNEKDLIVSKGALSDSGRAWTAPVMLYNGAKYQTDQTVGALTTYLLRQIKAGIVDIGSLNSNMDGFLYINAMGDIVTEDNTVILPMAANPIMYKNLAGNYIPFTVAMMSHYPRISLNGNSMYTSDYEGKYLVLDNYLEDHLAGIKMTGETNFDVLDTMAFQYFRMDLAEPIAGAPNPFKKIPMEKIIKTNSFFYNFGMKSTAFFKGLAQLNARNKSYVGPSMDYWVIIGLEDILIEGDKNLFSYSPHNDSNFAIASYYARNYYKSITMDSSGMPQDSSTVIDHDYIFRNFVVEGLNGTLYADSYTKNITTNTSMVQDVYGFWEGSAMYLGEHTLKAIGYKDNLLGMKSFYENKFFGPIIAFVDEYLIIILGVILLLLLIRFLKERESFFRLSIFSLGLSVSLLVFVKIFPIYIPVIYNFVVTNVNSSLGYDILNLKTEKYDHTYGKSGLTEDESQFLISGTSVNLYKFTDSQLRDFMEANNMEKGTANSGKIYMVDSTSGIFLEGNSLKVSTDLLFKNNPITGSYTETDLGSIYQIESSKLFSSSLDYYTPYFQIQDGLIQSINNIPKIFKVPLNSLIYLSGITKDSFMFFNYVNSAPFLSPSLYDNPDYGFTEEEINNMSYFYDNGSTGTNSYDFLNLDLMLREPTEQMKETLWYRSFVQNGFLDDEEKYWNLIQSVNLLTKKFMIELGKEVSLMSDENLIKVTSLYATTVFNQKISNAYNWVYPTSLNYQEFLIEDVYIATLTGSIDKYIAEDLKVTSHVIKRGTILSGFALVYNLWASFIISSALEILTLSVFLLFIALWLIKFTFSRDLNKLLKGFAKVVLASVAMATAFYSAFGIADTMSLIPALMFLTLVQTVILYFMFVVITAVLMNISELGDGKFSERMKSISDLFKSLNAKINPLSKERKRLGRKNRYRDYARYDRDIDDDDINYTPSYKPRRRATMVKPDHHRYEHHDSQEIDELEKYRREKERLEKEKRKSKYDTLEG